MKRRKGLLRRAIPWALTAIAVAIAVGLVLRAVSSRDIVAEARALRLGDPAAGRGRDPVASLELLEPLIEQDPGNTDALLEQARAWADLRGWDKAIAALEQAADAAPTIQQRIEAKIMAMNFLALADRYEEAVSVGEQIVSLQPENRVHALRLGRIYYMGSQDAQAAAQLRFSSPGEVRRSDEATKKRLEAAITDIWGEPDIPALVAQLTPGADAVLRDEIADEITTARRRFLLAEQTLGGYRTFGGFDPLVAVTWAQVLLRTGRLFEAHLEAAVALREPSLNSGQTKDFLEVQALCAIAIGDHAQAAALYERIILAYEADRSVRTPAVFLWSHYEQRVLAEDWDWILANVDGDIAHRGDDAVLHWAKAAALDAKGRGEEAERELSEPFASVSMGARGFAPPSLRLFPERRRSIAMLAYKLYTESGDRRAGAALDAVLAGIPGDREALELRSELFAQTGRDEAAMQDAFALLTSDRRDRGDFDRWYAAADALSEARFGSTLAERASAKVDESVDWLRSQTDASVTTFQTLGARKPGSRAEVRPDQLFFAQDPALTWAISLELVDRDLIERARNELRKLTDAFPQVQEFRLALGRLLVREGQFDFAAAEFERLLDDVPGDNLALELAMRAEIALGHRDAAARLVSRMILLDPVGVGALRYGLRLIQRDHADQAQKLVERIARWTDFGQRTDFLFLAARASLAQGKLDDVEAILATLSAQYPDAFEVGMLALDLGLARQQTGLVDAAVASLKPITASLFPDQMARLSSRLREHGLYDQLVRVFDDQIVPLPATKQALPDVAAAWLALGRPEKADEALSHLPVTRDTLVDRFVLGALQGRADEACRRLRLDPGPAELASTVDLLLACGQALMELDALRDATPLARLKALGADKDLGPAQLELLDGLLRLLPSLGRLEDVAPAAVVDSPRTSYPLAGADLEKFVALARSDRVAARRLGEDIMGLLLMGDRPLWARTTRELAQHALTLQPALSQPARTLARRALDEGRPRDALALLQPLLLTEAPDPDDLRLFLRASADFGHPEWGVALALFFDGQPQPMAILAEALRTWGHADEARGLFERALGIDPALREARIGLVGALSDLRETDELVSRIKGWTADLPEDPELFAACADALAALPRPDAGALALMEWAWRRSDGLLGLGEALARAEASDPAAAGPVLEELLARVDAHPLVGDEDDASVRLSMLLLRAARTARSVQLPKLARKLNEAALRTTPGAVQLYRELAFLELDEGRLEEARSYLEVLSFVDVNDREAAMALANLDFQQLGQPVRAAEIVRRTFTSNPPPEMTEILAAEAWLLGRPTDALNDFYSIGSSPLITPDTYWTVARIAFAAGQDDVARSLFDLFLARSGEDDGRRARAEYLKGRARQTAGAPASSPASSPAAEAADAEPVESPAPATPAAGTPDAASPANG